YLAHHAVELDDAAPAPAGVLDRRPLGLRPQHQRRGIAEALQLLDDRHRVLGRAADGQTRDDVHDRDHGRDPVSVARRAYSSIEGPIAQRRPERAWTEPTPAAVTARSRRRPPAVQPQRAGPGAGLASAEFLIDTTSNPLPATRRRSAVGPNAKRWRIG